jgi:hypothetical protein
MGATESISQLGLTFFGLTSNTAAEFRLAVFKQIHEIVFHGQGGYDWDTVYNMPLWLRRFTFNEIRTYYEQQNESAKKSQASNNKSLVNPDGTVNTPEFVKASKEYKGKTNYK